MNVIDMKGLTKSYGDFKLGELELNLPSGCILGLIGENGAGKTTALKLLLGIVKPDGGSASVLGEDIGGDMCRIKEDVGVVLDEPGLPDCLTVHQVDKIMGNAFSRWSSERFFQLAKKLALPEDKAFKDFSRGMKMKIGIAIAMSHDPKLLILDEPTSGLDPVVRDEVVDLFLDFTRDPQHSILISSHIVSDLEKLCDYIAFLHKGKLMLFEEKDELLTEYSLIQCSGAELSALQLSSVIGRRDSRYGCTAIVRREAVPEGIEAKPINLEDLFVFMIKEVER